VRYERLPISERRTDLRRPRALRAWLLAGLIAAATAGGSRAAAAAPGAAAVNPKVAAKKKLVEGAELLKRREFQAALDCFQTAYGLLPSPKIQYNIGLAYMGLGRNAEAIMAFHAFLSDASDASADTITSARVYNETLVQKICRLTVHADVAGASIGVDGRRFGSTPRTDEILLDAGPHTLVVEKPGMGKPFSKSFDLVPGGAMTIEAKLLPPKSRPTSRLIMEPPPMTASIGGGGVKTSGNLAGVVQAPAPAPDSDAAPKWAKPAGYVAGGLAVLALGLGTTEWVVKEQKFQRFNSGRQCTSNPNYPDMGAAGCAALLKDGNTAKNIGYIGFAAAGALGAVSAVFFMISSRDHSAGKAETALACAPSLDTPGGTCRLRF
jgi:PEGA domain